MKRELKNMKGITLIALVITIIVLLILAGVSIAMLTGDNGIITQANNAKVANEKATAKEKVQVEVGGSRGTDGKLDYELLKDNLKNVQGIENAPDSIEAGDFPLEVTVDGYKVTIEDNGTVTVEGDTTGGGTVVGEKPGKPDENGLFTEKSTINGQTTSSKNNPLIPVGFKPVDQGTAVWGDGKTPPTEESVHAGLVIEDGEGNQYVWIAVDGVMQEAEGDGGKTLQNAVEGEIVLGRYVFKSDGTINTTANVTPITLGGELKTSSSSSYKYTENLTELSGFINSVKTNGGYYIARYEASYGVDGKSNSKISNGYTENDGQEYAPTGEEQEGHLWNNITREEAKNACQDLYTGKINSDLMNSYAWDTAILFIQKYSGNIKYSREIGESETDQLNNTGINKLASTGKEDVVCNIYDMAGNCSEWVTEACSDTSYPYVRRGGYYGISFFYTSSRGSGNATLALSTYSFRPLLYL